MGEPEQPADIIDALLALPGLGRVVISPDGSLAAWTWYRKGPSGDVFVAPTSGTEQPRRLTSTANDTMVVGWSGDGSRLIVAEDRGGNERVQLFALTLDGRMSGLTEAGPAYYVRGGAIGPDARFLVYAANVDPGTGTVIDASWVIRQDLATGERRVLARPAKPHSFAPLLSRDGTRILYARRDRDPAGTQIWVTDIEGAIDRELVNLGAATKTSATWLADGRRALVVADSPTHKRLGICDVETGALRWLIDDPARAIEGATVTPLGDRILVRETKHARTISFLVDEATGADTAIALAEGTVSPITPLPDGAWLGTYCDGRQGPDLVRFALDGSVPRLIGTIAGGFTESRLKPTDLVAPEDVRWRADDGLEIQGWFYRARNPRGLVVQIHGGPTAHSEAALSIFIQACVTAGFSVLDPNYRGSTGFGIAYREAIRARGWGALEQDDIRAGIEFLIARGDARPGKVGVTGTSYGGYSSWCAITRYGPDIIAASAPICGMTDLVIDYYSTRPDLRPYSEEMLGGSPETVPDVYRERSPIHFVDRIRAPLLIVQGMNDPNVTPENLHAVETALKNAGVPYETLLFDDEGHGIRRPANQKILYRRLIAFFGTAFAR